MIIIKNFKKIYTKTLKKTLVLTIGNFDGVHLGHQALLYKTQIRANKIGGTPAALTFDPHPIQVLRPTINLPLITSIKKKIKLIQNYGIKEILCINFDENLALLSANDFIKKILIEELKVTEVVIGYNFLFGYNSLGNPKLLNEKSKIYGFKLNIVPPITIHNQIVSSTLIRQTIKNSNIKKTRQLLGRNYSITGKIIFGYNRGKRLLGYPTANLQTENELLPGTGVYATILELTNGRLLPGVTNIGINPTFNNKKISIETFLLNFNDNLYAQTITLHFIEFIRPEIKFFNINKLSNQIKSDVNKAHQLLDPWIITKNNHFFH